MSFDVCIIGAGVIGLSVALNIQRLMRLVNVTVVADSFGQGTNTPVMESLFIPSPSRIEEDINHETAMNWFTDAWEHHFKLATGPNAELSGNTLKAGTALWWHEGQHVLPQCVADYRLLSREEMDEREFNVAYGADFTTVHVDPYQYLRWLLRECLGASFQAGNRSQCRVIWQYIEDRHGPLVKGSKIRQNGGQMKHDTVFSLQELYGQYDVVVNCVGIRGRELKADEELHFVRSAMLQTMPISIDNFLVTQDDVYVCPHPRTGHCDIGFMKSFLKQESEVDEDCQWHIKHHAAQYLPEIKEVEVVEAWSEKRATRLPILLEIEFLNCDGPVLPIVHNIGYGDKTISLAWGRGIQAAHLVQEVQRMIKPFAKKWYPFGKI